MMKTVFATLSLLLCLTPSWVNAAEPSTGETEVTDCRFESDVKAKIDMDDTQNSSTKESKGDKKAVNGT